MVTFNGLVTVFPSPSTYRWKYTSFKDGKNMNLIHALNHFLGVDGERTDSRLAEGWSLELAREKVLKNATALLEGKNYLERQVVAK